MKIQKLLLAGWLAMPFAGCASMYDSHYESTQKIRTHHAWRALPDCAKSHCYPHDYELGWREGYYDVLTGGKGCPPVIAPERYWKPKQIIDNCDNRRHAYYSGFQDGASAASSQPDTHYLKMWSSCECPLPVCEPCCPPAVPACSNGGCGILGATEAPAIPTLPIASDPLIESKPIDYSVRELTPDEMVKQFPVSPAAPPAQALNSAASESLIRLASPLSQVGLLEDESTPAKQDVEEPTSAPASPSDAKVPKTGKVSPPPMTKPTTNAAQKSVPSTEEEPIGMIDGGSVQLAKPIEFATPTPTKQLAAKPQPAPQKPAVVEDDDAVVQIATSIDLTDN